MARLTPGEKRLLRRTGDAVRMYLACLTFAAPVLCVVFANQKYDRIRLTGVAPEIPQAATYGTITGIYLPIFAAVAAYVWATRAFPARSPAPHGFAMAMFRDAFTILVASVVLLIPVLLYHQRSEKIEAVNTLLVWYQTIITAVAGGAFTYYFHGSIAPAPKEPDEGRPRPKPSARKPPSPAESEAS